MKSIAKSFSVLIMAAAIALSVFAGLFMRSGGSVSAEETAVDGSKYFYTRLGDDELAKKFYETFEKLADAGLETTSLRKSFTRRSKSSPMTESSKRARSSTTLSPATSSAKTLRSNP